MEQHSPFWNSKISLIQLQESNIKRENKYLKEFNANLLTCNKMKFLC